MQIKRVIFPKEGEVAVERNEATLEATAGEVVVRTLYSCVSAGTELAKLTGEQVVEYPFVPGNRAVGEVMSVGAGVTRVKPGDVIFTHAPHVSHAKEKRFMVPVPGGVRLDHAATLGMSLVSITALRQGKPELGDWAVVFGTGMVGNFCAQLYALSGAEVVAVDVSPARLEVARQCGIPHVVDATGGDVVGQILRLTEGRGAEFVVEATGEPSVFDTASSVAKRGGEVILLGSPRRELQCNLTPVLQKVHLWRDHGALTLKGAHEWRYPLYEDAWAKHSLERNAKVILRLMQQERLQVAPLVSHVLPPEDAARAFEGLLTDKAAWTGVVFDWTASK